MFVSVLHLGRHRKWCYAPQLLLQIRKSEDEEGSEFTYFVGRQ